MTSILGALNVALGLAYTTYGFLTIADLRKGWKTMGFSHFGMAWIAMAFTCGPHHLVHGIHLLFENRPAGGLDLLAVAVGLPAGAIFLGLRFEAVTGGRGDRFVAGTPAWLRALPTMSGVYLTVLAIGAAGISFIALPPKVIPNLVLVVLYLMIGYFLLRTQLRNRKGLRGWSASGLALSVVFPTCALMHGVYAMYTAAGIYADVDAHGYLIDLLAVPAAMYFLWVVRGLYRQSIKDWNRGMVDAAPDRSAVVAS